MFMKTVNVKAYGLNEVKKQCPFTLQTNGTTMWKKAGSPMGGTELKEFMQEYLLKHTKNAPGLGCYIVMNPATFDSRNNPYRIENIPTKKARKMKRIYELVNSETNEVLGQADSKEAAMDLAKTIVTQKRAELGVDVKHNCIIKKVVEEGEPVAFTFEYAPSKNAKQGDYLCFGFEKETI